MEQDIMILIESKRHIKNRYVGNVLYMSFCTLYSVFCILCYVLFVMCYVLCVMCYVLCVMCYVLCVMCYVLCVGAGGQHKTKQLSGKIKKLLSIFKC